VSVADLDPQAASERRQQAWRAARILLLSLLVFDALAFFAGDAPLGALGRALGGTWGTPYGAAQVLYKATPLLFTGVAFDVARRAGLFNIGVEGQLGLGSLAAAVVAASLPAGSPWPIALPLALAAAAAVGALWASVAGVLRVQAGASEVISTIVLNRIADALVPFLLAHGAGVDGTRTREAIAGARLPRLDRWFEAVHGSALNASLLLAIGAAAAAALWQRRTRAGREIGWVGENPSVCEAQGLDVGRRLLLAMALSGAAAGLGASATVLGYKGYHELGLGAGAGFGGVAVALIGRGHPIGMLLAALLLGTLQQAGLVLNATLPRESMDVLTAAVILLVAAGGTRRAR
jgi:simple sugar transport system permease protein